MAKPESRTTETIVGLFVLLGLAVISILVFAIAGKQKLFEPRYRLIAIFSQVGGLKVGSPVRLAGLEVGSVESMGFTPLGKVEAVLSIRSRYQDQIRRDSEATISSVGILGDKSVEITIGSKKAEVLASTARIETRDPFDVAEFVDRVGPMAVKVDEILTYLSKITGEFSMGDLQLTETIQHAKNVLKKLDQGKGSLGAAVNDQTLYNEMVALAHSGSQIAQGLQETLNKIESASVEFPELIASARKAMEDISAISEDLRESTKQLPRIAAHAGEAVDNVRVASQDLPAIAGSFRNTAHDAEDVMQAAKRNWLIRGNLPERSTGEERILFDEVSPTSEEVGP